MVYKNNIVAAIKVNGRVLREDGESVTLPFGAEYSILVKNLSAVRLQVKISVDGQDATEGTWLVIPANESIELERFIKNGNLSSGNKFKFIERTRQIEQHRGIKIDDSLIRIEAKKEKPAPEVIYKTVEHYHHDYWPWYPYKYWFNNYPPYTSFPEITYSGPVSNTAGAQFGNFNKSDSVLRSSSSAKGSSAGIQAMTMDCNVSVAGIPSDVGITVPGSQSNQQFQTVSSFATERNSEVIVIHLRGTHNGQAVTAPVNVRTKLKCSTCGKSNKSTTKFCVRCGTAVEII